MATVPALGKQIYTCGTLRYTKSGLFVLMFWLLWGDFCFTLMERVLPAIFPLYMLGALGANNKTTALLMSIIPNIFGILVGPAVSFKSDRFRSKWGRRIPFIIWTAPVLVLALVGLGFSDFFFRTLQVSTLPELAHIHPMTATLMLIGFFMILFAFMNEFVNSVYWYLFADVVPEQFLGRFLALFRLVGLAAAALFSAFVFPYADTHMHWIFLGGGLLYLIGFSLMCWRVKEGEYPPPDDLGEKPSVFKQASVYIKECFAEPIYILLFLYTMCYALSTTAGIGGTIFMRDGLHISLAQMGAVGAVVSIISMLFQFPSGWLVDKFHALRMMLFMSLFLAPLQIAMFFCMQGFESYILFEGTKLVIFALYGAAGLPLLMTIFPKDKYGQYCSCNGMMKSLAILLGAGLGAAFIDIMTRNGQDKDAYRWMYIWNAGFQVLCTVLLYMIYALWKKHGGDGSYVAPGSALAKQREAEGREAVTVS